MARHGERVHKRKDGRWEGRYKTGNSETGRTMYRSVYGKTYSEVKEKLRNAENNPAKNLTKPNRNEFSTAIECWFSSAKPKLKMATAHKYEYLIEKHLLPSLGGVPLVALTPHLLNTFAEDKLANGSLHGHNKLSKSYVRTMMYIVASAIGYAAQEGWCQDISGKIYKPTPQKNELHVLSIAEQKCLEQNLLANLSPTAIGILITLQTGLRIGEICALTWENFDWKNNVLYVRSTISRIKNPVSKGTVLVIDTPKTENSLRAIPFGDDLKALLIKMKECSSSEFVVSDKEGFISPRTFEYRYHKIMKQCRLPKLNYHALRHTFATRCIEYGVDVKSLSEILGHANIATTLNTYVHSSLSLKREQLNKLPALSLS